MPSLVIFDCDGVLVDNELIGQKIERAYLASIGYHITAEENVKRFMGKGYQYIRDTVLAEKARIFFQN